MNRRTLVKAMLTVPVAGALSGCRREPQPETKPEAKPGPSPVSVQGGTLRVVLHGPFAVIINKAKQFRIQAFVPYDEPPKDGEPKDEGHKHEFHVLSQKRAQSAEIEQDKLQQFRFELSEDGLEVNRRYPYVDHAFDDFFIDVGSWKPSLEKYFVYLDLPAPDVITYDPLFVPTALLENGKTARMPLEHILEYRVHDWSKVQLRSPQLDGLGPLSCEDFHKMHQESLVPPPKDDVEPELDLGPRKLMRCSDSDVRKIFLGVGLPKSDYDKVKLRNTHARKFFNLDLLGSIPNSRDKRVQAFDVNPCRPIGEIFAEPRVVPAMQSYPTMEPRFIPVASIEDCRAGGVTGTTH